MTCINTEGTLTESGRQMFIALNSGWLTAEELAIRYAEKYPLKSYPCIKCNVSRKDGTKIYHLPFDQQYDRTLVEEERNECYVENVSEA